MQTGSLTGRFIFIAIKGGFFQLASICSGNITQLLKELPYDDPACVPQRTCVPPDAIFFMIAELIAYVKCSDGKRFIIKDL